MEPVIWFALAAVIFGLVAVLLAAARKRRAAKQRAGAGKPPQTAPQHDRITLEGVPVYFGVDLDDDRKASDGADRSGGHGAGGADGGGSGGD